MNFGGHQTFGLRDHWLYKGLRYLDMKGDCFSDVEMSIESLGVGANMVSAIRYWLTATRVAEVVKNELVISHFGRRLLKHDQYFDQNGTAWLIHYSLATNKERATTWYWFFNKFGVSEFTMDAATHYLNQYVGGEGKKVKLATLGRDLQALIGMYLPPKFEGRSTPEDNAISPLARLGLIQKKSSDTFTLHHPVANDIPTSIFGYCLVQFWINELNKAPEFQFDEIVNRDGSPGKIFGFSVDQSVEILDKLVESYPKQFSYNRSGGFFNVKIHSAGVESLLGDYYGG